MPEQTFAGSLKPGAKLGKYEVGEQIATGGMAVIYKAYDPSLDRSVAIKQIAPHLAQDERFLARFRTEAQTLAKLSSSQANIVNVHELIQQDGQLYLVMEYVEGTTLRSLMDRGPVPLQAGLGVLLSTALGLRAMHKNQIVHRDLTPANVMMAKDGALKITDFGLIGHSGGKTSLPMGTTKYMAPEMFTGAPVDGRADLYSLGFIAYEMFAGPEKFQEVFRDVLRDDRAQQVRWMHWHSNPALAAPPLKDLQPGIPPLVSKIVERMMEKDPSKRFASTDQIIKWLRRIFVMHVQGKSLTQTDSEALEKEMESEAAAPPAGPPARRPAGRPQAATGQAPQSAGATVPAPAGEGLPAETSAEKTAPLPEAKWTWKRAAFWAAVIGGPLIAIAAGLIIWHVHATGVRMHEYRKQLNTAEQAYNTGNYEAAMNLFGQMAVEFEDMKDQAAQAAMYAKMAEAEYRLAQKDWDKAADAADAAKRYHARASWTDSFFERLQKAKEKEHVLNAVETAAEQEDYTTAIELLADLQGKHGIDLNDEIAKYRELNDLRDYNRFIGEAKQALADRDYNKALADAEKAKTIRAGPEADELIQTIQTEKKLDDLARLLKRAEDSQSYPEVVAVCDEILEIRPSESIRQKKREAQAKQLEAQARKLQENGLTEQCLEVCKTILTIDPNNAYASGVLKQIGRQETLHAMVAEGEKAMKAREWQQAINSYSEALKLIEAETEAKLKEQIESQINKARYHLAIARAREAMEQKDWSGARDLALKAQGFEDTSEVQRLLEQIETRRQYYSHLDIGKELLKQLNYPRALDGFKRAQEIMDTAEVRALIAETNFRMHHSKARSYFEDKQFKKALGRAKIAQKYKDTEEIQGFIRLLEQLIDKQGQSRE